jgi:hypothetical protein
VQYRRSLRYREFCKAHDGTASTCAGDVEWVADDLDLFVGSIIIICKPHNAHRFQF